MDKEERQHLTALDIAETLNHWFVEGLISRIETPIWLKNESKFRGVSPIDVLKETYPEVQNMLLFDRLN